MNSLINKIFFLLKIKIMKLHYLFTQQKYRITIN